MGSFSILYNASSVAAQYQLNTIQANLTRTINRLSSGKRINSGSDDPAGIQTADSLRADIMAISQSARNANDGIAVAMVADSAMSTMEGLLNRAITIASQATCDTIDSASRSSLQNEWVQIQYEIGRILNSTNFNGVKLFEASENLTTNSTSAGNLSIFLGDASSTNSIDLVFPSIRMNGSNGMPVLPASPDETPAKPFLLESSTFDALTLDEELTIDFYHSLTGDKPIFWPGFETPPQMGINVFLKSGDTRAQVVDKLNAAFTTPTYFPDSYLPMPINAYAKDVDGRIEIQAPDYGDAHYIKIFSTYSNGCGFRSSLKSANGVDGSPATVQASTDFQTLANNETLTIVSGASPQVDISLNTGDDLSAVVSKINQALASSGIGATASNVNGRLTISTNADGGQISVASSNISSGTGFSTTACLANGAIEQPASLTADYPFEGFTSGEELTIRCNGNDYTLHLNPDSCSDLDHAIASINTEFAALGANVTAKKDNLNRYVIIETTSAGASQHLEISSKITTTGFSPLSETVKNGSGIDLSATDFNTSLHAMHALTEIKRGLDSIASCRGCLGGRMNRLQEAVLVSEAQSLNIQAAESTIRDANMAEELAVLVRQQILIQTGINAISEASVNQQSLLKLFATL
jgi:flagellin